MIRFLIRRAAFGIAAILAVSALVFFLVRTVPTSPALLVLGGDASDTVVAAFEAKYGLDRPVLEQYLSWLW
jgi:peptide/nickel transport system permease protein